MFSLLPLLFLSLTEPEVVTNLTVTSFTTSSITLNWTEPEGKSSFYRVQWTDGGKPKSMNVSETLKTITNLTPGVQYNITVTAVADDKITEGASVTVSHYTKPEVVTNLNVINVTTSSVFVSWDKPEGNSSFYRVQWTDGNVTNVTETFLNITNLTAGVQYNITVTAVADDGVTKGRSDMVSQYTQPAAVRDLSVTEITTSSLNLNWTEPVGSRYFYIVQWTDGTTIETVTETKLNVSKLTPGVRYSFTVIAVAGDNETKSEKAEIWHYTKPEVVNNLTVTEITTSSIHLNWTAPQGDRSFYVVQWTNGTTIQSVTETKLNVTGLTPGVYYNFNVIAVAGDNETKSEKAETSHYTKPGVIQNHNVTTDNSSISLNWTAPPGRVFKYRVELSNGSSLYTERTNNTFVLLSSLTPGTSYNVTVTAIAGDNKTEGEPFNVTVSTHPAVVINLTVTDVTTTSVSLSWSKPEGNADLYIIRCEGTKEMNSSNETFTIRDLTPGVKYSISVAAVAYSKEGVKAFTSTFTTPKKPVNITAVRGTNKLNISWILPLGRADRYVVEISNTDFMNSNSTNATVTNVLFTDLYPGRIFVIKVTAVAGNLNSTSDPSPIATVPNPPGSIVLVRRTNSSLQLQWTTPAMMEGAPNISYYITYKFINQFERDTIQNETSLNNSTELSPLLSGTSYNISVQTVGPQNLRSTFVNISNFTLPNPVLNVKASPSSTSSVTVTWSYPVGVRSYYEYVVEVYNPTGGLVNTTISMTNSTIISQLEPGSEYNVSVTTRAAQGITSTAEQTSSYTMPKAVTNITVNYRNTTSIQLTWLRQSDYKSSYRYRVSALLNGIEVHNGSTSNETYTFYPLVPGTQYEFTVSTVVEEVKSTEQKLRSQTIPEATSDIVVIGSTTNLTVKWNPVNGRVDSYSVLLYRDMQQVDNATDLSNNTLIYVFTSLKPGVLYCAEVVTKSGPLESNHSDCNATFPNPPGPITVESQTVRSINFTWTRPENMDRNQYNFSVSTNESTFVTANNWFLRDSLSSGQPYSISVVTVGVRNYKSTPVTARNYTQPHPASNLTHTKVTTGNVTLLWDQRESRPDYTYLVQVINGSQNIIRTEVVNEAKVSITGLLSGSNFSFTVTTRAADGTAASPETANFFTLPHMVRDLNAETLNTTAIKLSWKEPLEYKPYYRYWVRTAGCASQNTVLQENTTLISELSKEISKLTPGTNCSLCVSVVVADLITGEEKCTFQYTWPETAQLQISSKGSNSSVVVSWTHPIGNVEYYVVLLKHPNGTEDQRRRSNNSTEEMFDNLSAGRLYNATITTFSGPFNASSSFVTNATYPNPPGAITIQMKTINAIDFKWGEAPLMSGASFSYQMTNTPAYGATNATNVTTAPSNITNHTFASLDSGTSYNITVATVGVLGYQSERVYIYLVTTRPLSVESLMSQAEEMNILVSWSRPDDYKESYRYFVTWESSDTNIRRNTTCTSCTDYNITDLEPGSHYNISVTTETSDGTRAATMPISNCTKASRVTILNVTCPDKEIAEITLNWTKPRGRFFEFKVMAKPENQLSIINNSSETRHTFSNLAHHTNYSLTVVTLSCGNPSAPVTTSCQTGITNPLIPAVFENPVVKVKLHNQFTLQINSELLNNSRGPIEAVGVLVKRQTDVNSSLIQHLRNTYEEWTAGRTKVYLATVTKNFTPLSRSTQPFHFDIQVGTGSKVENYFNGPLTPREHYQAAVMVSTRLIYTNGLVDISQSFVAITGFVDIGVLPPDPVIVPIAVGVTLGIFFILSIILIGFIIYWKRLSNKESSDIQIHSMRAKVSVAVTVEDFEAYYKKQKADSNCGFAEEFEDLKIVGTGQAKIHALDLENKPKNRYNNVLPYDSSRVKLSIIHGSPFDDYINANYMPGYNSRKEYIAAQGPLPTTVNDFWRMIWEKNVQTLVMLTRCNEQGRVKCEQYWSSGTKHFEDITVTTTSEIPLEDWTIRDFDIKYVKTAETRSVRHFHFTAWPDHGVPETTELLISFRHLVREHMNQYSRHSPTVVHCSAGVGRTGTFIAIDRLIFQIERENIVDVYGIVHDLRMHRPLMVQTEDQYVFLNQCALDVIRSRTGTNVDLIYQNAAALSIYENVEPKRGFHKNGYHNA